MKDRVPPTPESLKRKKPVSPAPAPKREMKDRVSPALEALKRKMSVSPAPAPRREMKDRVSPTPESLKRKKAVIPAPINPEARNPAYAPSTAKAHFIHIAKTVASKRRRAGITNTRGEVSVVIDYKDRFEYGLALDVAGQDFKNEFSTHCRLASYGVVFRVKLAGVPEPVYVYKYEKTKVAGSNILREWTKLVSESLMDALREEYESRRGPDRLDRLKQEAFNEELRGMFKAMNLAMQRIPIGHHPSREGRIGPLDKDDGQW